MTARSLAPSTPRGEATRQRVLEAAEQVFGEKGYHGASVTEITRAAGVAQGTFYLYFHGKKEIFLDLVDTLGARLLGQTREASAAGRDYPEAQRLGFRAFFQFIRGHRHLYRIIGEADRVDPLTYRRFYTSLADAYSRAIGQAESRGELPLDDPEVLAYCMMGAGHFVAMRYLFWDEELSAEAEEAALRFVVAGIRNRG
jgi:AcrR family transcriptional regulator